MTHAASLLPPFTFNQGYSSERAKSLWNRLKLPSKWNPLHIRFSFKEPFLPGHILIKRRKKKIHKKKNIYRYVILFREDIFSHALIVLPIIKKHLCTITSQTLVKISSNLGDLFYFNDEWVTVAIKTLTGVHNCLMPERRRLKKRLFHIYHNRRSSLLMPPLIHVCKVKVLFMTWSKKQTNKSPQSEWVNVYI